MSDQENHNISLSLYQHMCRHIVGSEKTVKTKRMFIMVHDDLMHCENVAIMTSGSFGEGLEMEGSDFDMMYVLKFIEINDNKSDIKGNMISFEINTDDTKIGFVKLQLRHSVDRSITNLCVKVKGVLFLSNVRFKHFYGNCAFRGNTFFIAANHGPCLSDERGIWDFAFCLHSESWINQADAWIKRPRGSWPGNEVVSRIIEHGVLFVPIGVKDSPSEEIEWRISFSVGEKLLIYSFNHTQLLCYALMKIVLKDIISTDIRCNDLLCSYYMKNIMFWVSEETHSSEWKPHNLIHCFMRCFFRLLYCVEYSICPHYFIPQNNMFENKIEGRNRQLLLDKLNTLYNLNWQCILLSPRLQYFSTVRLEPQSFVDYFEQINSSKLFLFADGAYNYDRAVQRILLSQSRSRKLYYYYYMLHSSRAKAEDVQVRFDVRNKALYTQYKRCESYLQQAVSCNAVTGSLQLASLYYRMKQLRKTLAIIVYSLQKICLPYMIYGGSKLSSRQRRLLSSKIFRCKSLCQALQLLRLEKIIFKKKSKLIPQELELEAKSINGPVIIQLVVYAHFLSFLCHYNLNDDRGLLHSLNELARSIEDSHYHIGDMATSLNVSGVALQIIGKYDIARLVFQCVNKLDTNGLLTCATARLSLIN